MPDDSSQPHSVPKETTISVAPSSPEDDSQLENQSVRLESTQHRQDETAIISDARSWSPGYKLFVSLSAILSCFSM